MDAFEQVVSGLFFSDGYWVTQGYKVELTKEQKRAIGKPSSPRWEIDLVAYKGSTNELLAVECKSYLDSTGVAADDIIAPDNESSRYKLFVDTTLRNVVLNQLAMQLHQTGLIPPGVTPRLTLVAGKIKSSTDTIRLREHFAKMEWNLFDTSWLVERLEKTADQPYFDSVAHVVSKLILRNSQLKG